MKAGAVAVPVFSKWCRVPKRSPTTRSRSPSLSRSAKLGVLFKLGVPVCPTWTPSNGLAAPVRAVKAGAGRSGVLEMLGCRVSPDDGVEVAVAVEVGEARRAVAPHIDAAEWIGDAGPLGKGGRGGRAGVLRNSAGCRSASDDGLEVAVAVEVGEARVLSRPTSTPPNGLAAPPRSVKAGAVAEPIFFFFLKKKKKKKKKKKNVLEIVQVFVPVRFPTTAFFFFFFFSRSPFAVSRSAKLGALMNATLTPRRRTDLPRRSAPRAAR